MNKLLVATVLVCTSLSCSHTTGPESIKTPRDYTWEAIDLSSSYTRQPVMWCIWGSSANDVYACGTSPVYPMGTMYHYDGKS